MTLFTRRLKFVTMPAFVPVVAALFTFCPARAGTIAPNIFAYTASVVNTPVPNWALGNPQIASVGVCSVLVGSCGNLGFGALENEVGIALLTAPATFGPATLNGDTFVQEAANQIGADVRVPTAWWVTPAVYTWAGGGVAFFNSLVGGVPYANELVVLDPPPDPYTVLQDLSIQLGDPDPLPSPNTSLSPDSNGNVNVPNPSTTDMPEPASIVLLGLGSGMLLVRRSAGKR